MFASSPDHWKIWATGKTIVGALLGGYLGVETAKKAVDYTQPTGDLFALVAPIGIIFGRIGCLLHGCCLGQECSLNAAGEPPWWALRDVAGVPRWPAVPVEIAFNLIMLAFFLGLRWTAKSRAGQGTNAVEEASVSTSFLAGQHFHIYLMAYGVFRFVHEFVRATPRLVFGLTGYQFAALACVALGAVGFVKRAGTSKKQGAIPSSTP